MPGKLSNEEIARKYADKTISIACSMYNPAATRIAYEACLYGLTKAEKQQFTKAKELLKDVYKIVIHDWNDPKWHDQVLRKVAQFLKEAEK